MLSVNNHFPVQLTVARKALSLKQTPLVKRIKEMIRDFALKVGLGTKDERIEIDHGLRYDLELSYGGKKVHFMTEDNLKLEGMFCKAKDQGNKKTLLLCTGSHASYEFYAVPIVSALQEMGHDVLVFNYRGFGRSEGEPDEEGIYLDVEAAYQYLKEKGISDESLAVYGYSLGSAPAVDLACHHPVDLVLDRAFSSMAEVAADATFFSRSAREIFRRFAHFDNLSKIQRVQKDVLIFQATNDETMNGNHAKQLEEGLKRRDSALHAKRLLVPSNHQHTSSSDCWLAKECEGDKEMLQTAQGALHSFLTSENV